MRTTTQKTFVGCVSRVDHREVRNGGGRTSFDDPRKNLRSSISRNWCARRVAGARVIRRRLWNSMNNRDPRTTKGETR